MDPKRRLDNALDLAAGHQRPSVRLDQAVLPDLARGELYPRLTARVFTFHALPFLGFPSATCLSC